MKLIGTVGGVFLNYGSLEIGDSQAHGCPLYTDT